LTGSPAWQLCFVAAYRAAQTLAGQEPLSSFFDEIRRPIYSKLLEVR